jgi:hypothetical protein
MGSVFDLGKNIDYSVININNSYKLKVYEYSVLIITLHTGFCIVQETSCKIDEKEYNSLNFVAPAYLA